MISKICLVALASAVTFALLDSFGFKAAKLCGILFGIITLTLAIGQMSEIVSRLTSIAELGKISDYAGVALKAVGIGYLYSFCSDICQGLGEGTVSKGVTLAGRIHLLVIALPYIEQVAKLGGELLG